MRRTLGEGGRRTYVHAGRDGRLRIGMGEGMEGGAVMRRIWAGKGVRHSSEIRRRGSAWRRAVRGFRETRGLESGHLLCRERVEIERQVAIRRV